MLPSDQAAELIVRIREVCAESGVRIDRVNVSSTGTLYLSLRSNGRRLGQIRVADHRPPAGSHLRLSLFSVCVQRVGRIGELAGWLRHRILLRRAA